MIMNNLLKDTDTKILKSLKKILTKCHSVHQQENVTGYKLSYSSKLNTFCIVTDWL